jgi:UDP-N-acetylmuramate dehydrogenase
MTPSENVPLAPRCTMGIGGPARHFVEARDERAVGDALEWADRRGVPVHVLGGGSNLIVADTGVDGLVVKIGIRGVTAKEAGHEVELTAAAGEPWDDLVRSAVEQGWAGLESLSGIPGLVGGTPIQNVGAYGQEVSETVTAVRVLDRRAGQVRTLAPAECAFAYRDSVFKRREPERYVVLAVTYRLARGGAPAVRYPDVSRDLADRGIRSPSLADVRRSVLDIRRSKSMVLDPADPNRRSCGSFFVNPTVTAAELARIEGLPGVGSSMPRWAAPEGRVKLSAAWLIERAGLARGHREGCVGLSTRHALAIVCHEGATAGDVIAFAGKVRARVQERFGIQLVPEPVLWGAISLD